MVSASWVAAPPGKALGDDDLGIAVGACENGSDKVSDGMACEKAAEHCKAKTPIKASISIHVEPFGVGVDFGADFDVPLGCETDTHDRAECAPQEQYTTGAPGGNVTGIYALPCDPKEGITRYDCQETPLASIEVPMPQSIIDAAKKANQTLQNFIGAFKAPWAPKVNLPLNTGLGGFGINGNNLVINISGMKTCKTGGGGEHKGGGKNKKGGRKKRDEKTCEKGASSPAGNPCRGAAPAGGGPCG